MKRKWIKNAFKGLMLLLLVWIIWEHQLIWYGLNQGYGQARVLWKAKPVSTILANEEVRDSVKQRLRLIQEIKQFAVDSLGLDPSNSYEDFYDQQGKPILWTVTASEPFNLKAHEWSFSFLGKFSYKGHFKRKKAERDSLQLAQEGWDVEIDEVSAWSTLGWLADPILSSMLERTEGGIANLIIHELTHGTLYVKSDVDFNENLASFIGDQGALRFLQYKYGEQSAQYQDYIASEKDKQLFYTYILKKTQALQALYDAERFKNKTLAEKVEEKQAFIREIALGLAKVPFMDRQYEIERLKKWQPNNAFFMGYVRYRAQQYDFEKVLKEQFKGNI
ncbi:MAG: aminopeptidase, partial [Bacteroidota bacterium]